MDDYRNDIEKYLKGQLTPAQMHALEKKALSDPFLADALQGLDTLRPDEFQADLADLQTRVIRQTQTRGASWIWVGRVAAGLLLLAVATFVIIFIVDRQANETGNLALNKEERQEAERQMSPVVPPQTDSTPSGRSAIPEVAERQVEERQKQGQAAKPSNTRRSEQQPPADAVEASPRAESEAVESDIEKEISEGLEEGEKSANSVSPQSAPSRVALEDEKKTEAIEKDDNADLSKRKAFSGGAAKESADSYNVNRKIVRGKVTFSDDGTALPGVNVLVKGSNEGTVTDAQGNYQIPVEGQPTLQFSFIGFSTTEVEATATELDVKLDADVSELSEVVVVGYSEEVGFLPSTPTVMELATPEGGRKVFKQYLEQNLQYPQQALQNQVEGKVTVQFTISMTGQLSDFKVIRGLGFGCEEEVIRLIKQGPKWSPTKKNEAPIKDRARVRMRFSLPKK